MRKLGDFLRDEHGAITVDWVVLTAALVGLAVVVLGTISGPAADNANQLGSYLSSHTVATY